MIKILCFLLSSALKSVGGKCYLCQINILSCNSNGKLDYFKRNFHIWFAAITRLKNVRELQGELGQVECEVMLSLHFTESHPYCPMLDLKSEPYLVEVGEELEHFNCFFSLFDAAKVIR